MAPAILYCFWLEDETIAFRSRANPNGLNPEETFSDFLVNVDDPNPTLYPPFVPATLPDSHVVSQFTITQPVTNSYLGLLSMPGTPEYDRPARSLPTRGMVTADDGSVEVELPRAVRHSILLIPRPSRLIGMALAGSLRALEPGTSRPFPHLGSDTTLETLE